MTECNSDAYASIRLDVTAAGATCAPATERGLSVGCVGPTTRSTVCCDSRAGPSCPTGPGPPMVFVSSPGADFCMDATTITQGQYQAFLDAESPQAPNCDAVRNPEFEPVGWRRPSARDEGDAMEGVDWCDAAAYCAWAGKRLCGLFGGGVGDGRSDVEADPTRAEWSYACGQSNGCTRPFGFIGLSTPEWVASCDGNDCLLRTRCDSADLESEADWTDLRDASFRCCATPTP